MKWNIIVDSSSDMINQKHSTDLYGIDTVPLKINVGDKVFVDDKNLNVEELIVAMQDPKAPSSSACPSPNEFVDVFSKADNIICVTMTGTLSGTYNCACLAKDIVLENDPTKKICIIDSKGTAGMLILAARKAIEYISNGMEFEQVSQKLKDYVKQLKVVTTLGSYINLVKNGRMSPIAGILASKLNIKVVAENTDEGTIDVVKKVRGINKTYEAMINTMLKNKEIQDTPIVISHCKNLEGANKFKSLLEERFACKDITILECRGLTSYYCMPGGIIVSY